MLHNLENKKLILASKSPRRQELLKGLDVSFEIRTKDVEEIYDPRMDKEKVPVFLAELKAEAFQDEMKEDEIILTSDTIVIHDDKILEKPKDREQAIEMVSRLSDSRHTVITGVCIWSKNKKVLFSDHTKVEFESLSAEEIEYYIDRYQPYDKAGSYGVQEWIGYVGIKKLEGSYFNVMGLPLHRVYQELKSF
ncbi:MAG: Maf family nucleotide pyrophosphatase [Flavobacteriales bacterium]|nr:Maf family nucleotide pyrophosphatase [Flavobacteriales bacterium]